MARWSTDRDEDPLGRFFDKVRACGRGDFSVADAVRAEEERARACSLCESLERAFGAGESDELLTLMKQIKSGDVDDYVMGHHLLHAIVDAYLPEEWRFRFDRLGSARKVAANSNVALMAAKIAHEQIRGGDWKSNKALGTALAASGDLEGALKKLQRAFELETAPMIVEKIVQAMHKVQGLLGRELEPSLEADDEKQPAPAELSAEELVADLKEAHGIIKGQYGAYDCLAWQMAGEGTSWAARLEEFVGKARERSKWDWDEAFELLRQFLEIIQDAHFTISCGETKARFISRIGPFYSDVRVGRDGDGLKVVAGDERYVGQDVDGVGVVPSPYDARTGVAYLFPTTKGEYLLGVFGDVEKPLEEFEFPLGMLPLHRSRIFVDRDPETEETWHLALPPESALPLVKISLCYAKKLEGFFETANKVREMAAVVLDLRGNRGGTDDVPLEWMYRFNKQNYQWVGGASVNYNEKDPIKRWSSGFGRRLDEGPLAYRGEGAATKPFEGKFYVAIDKLVASAGETFTQMAAQVPGALLVGENTLGCVGYGGCFSRPPLRHSRVRLYFGSIKFCLDENRPIREGFGFFPRLVD